MLIPMFADGTDLTAYKFKRSGYNGAEGASFVRKTASGRFFLSAVRAYIASEDEIFWRFAKNIAKFNDLGNIGDIKGENVSLNLKTTLSDPVMIFALVDLYHAYHTEQYMDLANRIVDNIIKERFHQGYFFKNPNTTKVSFDSIDALALITLYAATVHKSEDVPAFIHGEGYIQGEYEFEDGTVRTISSSTLLA
jgi:hypothetical protein